MEMCACSVAVKKKWGTQKEQKGLSCVSCGKYVELYDDATIESRAQFDSTNFSTPRTKSVSTTTAPVTSEQVQNSTPSRLKVPKTPATLDDVVAAQNRTTRAVRAFVRFLFIQLSAISAGVVFIQWGLQQYSSRECLEYGNCSSADGLVAVGALIVLVGVIWSSSAGWSELHKSEIPD